MSQRRDRALPLWIDKEKEWSVMVKDYPPDETIQLYHRSGSRLNAWSGKGIHQDDGRPCHTPDTLVSHKVSIRRSRSVYRIRTRGKIKQQLSHLRRAKR